MIETVNIENLKKMSFAQLNSLATEIRQFLIQNVTKTGGHIASNLGAIELTIALHKVFNSPTDKLIFDVGHQCYTHKILTGRFDKFDTLRTHGGLSGFPNPNESEHDIFMTGHSSTSISMAAGISRAAKIKGENISAVAVIGDGALTGGMAFEALNDLGQSGDKVIVVLNDNQMSIDTNVGAMHSYFTSLRTSPKYKNFKQKLENILKKIPLIGYPIYRLLFKLKNVIKAIFVKDSFFGALGFTYIGVEDGHNIHKLCNAFEKAKNAKQSVVVHVSTKKGKGYKQAENDPSKYHGIAPENENGNGSNSAFVGKLINQLADKDPKIVAVTAAMGFGTGLNGFLHKDRYFDVGIAEGHAVGLCAGLSRQGLKPVFAVYSTFLQRAYDQIVHDICLQNLHVVFAIDRAGLVGADGATHHGIYDVSFLNTMPNITIFAPSTLSELTYAIKTAFDMHTPVAVRYPRSKLEAGTHINSLTSRELLPMQDVNIISYGSLISLAMSIGQQTNSGVFSAFILKPFDMLTINTLLSKEILVILEEGTSQGGYASNILKYAAEINSTTKIIIKGIDGFVYHGDEDSLLKDLGITENEIIKEILAWKKLDSIHCLYKEASHPPDKKLKL